MKALGVRHIIVLGHSFCAGVRCLLEHDHGGATLRIRLGLGEHRARSPRRDGRAGDRCGARGDRAPRRTGVGARQPAPSQRPIPSSRRAWRRGASRCMAGTSISAGGCCRQRKRRRGRSGRSMAARRPPRPSARPRAAPALPVHQAGALRRAAATMPAATLPGRAEKSMTTRPDRADTATRRRSRRADRPCHRALPRGASAQMPELIRLAQRVEADASRPSRPAARPGRPARADGDGRWRRTCRRRSRACSPRCAPAGSWRWQWS